MEMSGRLYGAAALVLSTELLAFIAMT